MVSLPNFYKQITEIYIFSTADRVANEYAIFKFFFVSSAQLNVYSQTIVFYIDQVIKLFPI